MLSYAVRKVLGGLARLAAVTVLLVLAFEAMPGDPVSAALGAHGADPALAGPVGGALGPDRALGARLVAFAAGLARGELGQSHRYVGTPVATLLAEAVPATVTLAAGAMALSLPAGVALGLWAAARAGRAVDRVITAGLTAALSLPAAALAVALIAGFAVALDWLPVAGWGGAASAVLPLLVLAVPVAGLLGRLARALAADALARPHVRTARAKGLPEHRVLSAHVLPLLAGPLLAAAGAAFGGLLGGAVVVETVFAIPGLGRAAAEAVLARDHPVVLGCALLLTTIHTLVGLGADLAAAAVDPRPSLRQGPP
ncbi:ABC transporter permease [Azospirillum soli]|uniref:ABC transporter permease n=1 Tax=Azospirillum soli TaxID=1304799 RepID=UPI001AEA083B|nr:ABC transporter permease [Azospirillum soli]MBP2312951.1 ABC-type dipeptide/oligopeptide/nickel transport system permease component [Azospirillum soli]